MSKPAKAGLLFLCLVAVAWSSVPAIAGDTEGDPENEIRVGFFMDPIDKTDRTDLKHTLDVWTDGFATERFPQTRISIYENDTQFRQALHSGTIDVGFIYSYQYSGLAEAGSDPAAVVGRDVEPTVQFVLLVGKENGIDKAKDLKGKKIHINTGRRGRLPLLWLERYLLSEGVSEDPETFCDVTCVADSFNAVAPLFFKNASACIITRKEYQENAKLNAQIVQELHLVATSLSMPTRVMIYSPHIDSEKKRALEMRGPRMKPAVYAQSFLEPVLETISEFQKGDLAEIAKLSKPAHKDSVLTKAEERTSTDAGE